MCTKSRSRFGGRPGTFPGEIAEGWYVVIDGAVIMTDADGKPTGQAKQHLNPGADARGVACAIVRERSRHRSSINGFHEKIIYQRLRY
jgi:hypothetical protein